MNRTSALATLVALSLSLSASGCLLLGGGPNGGGSASDDSGTDQGEAVESLRSCTDELPRAEVVDSLQITADYAESLHEMVACGGLAVALSMGISQGIVEMLLNSSKEATPGGWTYEGDGVYRTRGTGVEMTARLYAAEDLSFVAKGEPIVEDVFVLDNYLSNPRLSIDISTGRTLLSFEDVGPLVELLGLGAQPQSPVSLSVGDLDTLNRKLETLQLESTVIVDVPQGESIVRYETQSSPMAVKALLVGAPMEFEIVEAQAERDDTEQALTVDSWTIAFVGGNRLEGSSSYQVVGGLFDFFGEAVFDNASMAETTVSCTR